MTRSEITELLQPWIGRIENEEIREKVLDVYEKAIALSGYRSIVAFRAIPFTLLTDCRAIGLLEHTLAVTAGAVGLAQAQAAHYRESPYEINMDRLIAGGLLHDVGKILETEPDRNGGYRKSRAGMCLRHPISGVVLAHQAGLSDEVLNCIGCHAKEGEGRPQTVETILIHQADYATFEPLVMSQKGMLIT